jgi:hypothetical protein
MANDTYRSMYPDVFKVQDCIFMQERLFGNVYATCINNAEFYLENWYGTDWRFWA